MKEVDIRKDRLGDYLVCNYGKNKKPTTIQYIARCPECTNLSRFTGGPTTRRKTLRACKTIICPTCELPVRWRDGCESIGYFYELLKLMEGKSE